jgi:hypothetical protein
MGSVVDFYRQLEQQVKELCVWKGELVSEYPFPLLTIELVF